VLIGSIGRLIFLEISSEIGEDGRVFGMPSDKCLTSCRVCTVFEDILGLGRIERSVDEGSKQDQPDISDVPAMLSATVKVKQRASLLWRFKGSDGSHDGFLETAIQKSTLFGIWQYHLQNIEGVNFGDIVR
jgi:hypothetical protein